MSLAALTSRTVRNWTKLLAKLTELNALMTYDEGTQTLTNAGAVSLTVRDTDWSVTGTVAGTLANGTREGQLKFVRCSVAATSPVGVLTPATATGFSTLTFDAVNEYAILRYHATGGWKIVATNATVA